MSATSQKTTALDAVARRTGQPLRRLARLGSVLAAVLLVLTPMTLWARERDPVEPAVTSASVLEPDETGMANASATLEIVQTLYGDLGLRQPIHAAISPDDEFVYVASLQSNALVVLARDPVSQTLQFVEAQRDNQNGVDGLGGAFYVAVSPDGKHVYVAGERDNAVAVFGRNAATGRLTFVEFVQDGKGGVDGLLGVSSVVLDAGGRDVYVTGSFDQAISLFRRNASDGKLTYVKTYRNGEEGVSGLDGAQKAIISPDGKHIYVASIEDNSVVVFSRNDTTGELAFVEAIGAADDESGGVEGLEGPRSLVISGDGKHIYVAALNAGAVVVLARDANTGKLTPVETIFGPKLSGASDVAISGDGASVYVTGFASQTLVTYARDPATGKLELVDIQDGNEGGTASLRGISSVLTSYDDANLIVTGLLFGVVTLYERGGATGAPIELDTVTNISRPDTNQLYGLQAGLAAAVSPDGEHLYVGGLVDDAISVFERKANDGTVSLLQTVANGPGSESGLIGLQALSVSPDGKHVYAPGLFSNNIAVFARDTASGELTYAGAVQDGADGVSGLSGAYRVLVSQDGKHVYALGFLGGGVVVFTRDSASGLLTFVEFVSVSPVVGPKIVALPSALAIHPDGIAVYVTVQSTNGLVVFQRDPDTGKLTRIQDVTNAQNGVQGLDAASTVSVASDARHVYAAGEDSDGIAIFNVDATDGALTFTQFVQTQEPTVVQVAPDGNALYAVSKLEGRVSLFGRNPQSGILVLADEKIEGQEGVNGLEDPTALAVSPDSRFVYVPGGLGNSLLVFALDGDVPTTLDLYLPLIKR